MLPKVLPMHKEINSATKQKNLLRYFPTWALNNYWVVQYYQDPRARHFDYPTSLTFSITEWLYQITEPLVADETKCIKEESLV